MKTEKNKEGMTNEYIKERYDQDAKNKYKSDYEFIRWFANSRSRSDYAMMHRSVKNHLKAINFNKCLEIGPGPGTWTKLLYRKNPEASFDLIDISKEMFKQFNLEMRNNSNVNYNVGDFVDFEFSSYDYDFVFSARVIEYIKDKECVIEKIYNLLANEGKGMIITKNPLMFFDSKSSNKKHHTGRISHTNLSKILEEKGFKVLGVYPAIIRFPILGKKISQFSDKLFSKMKEREIKNIPIGLVESYIIIFSK